MFYLKLMRMTNSSTLWNPVPPDTLTLYGVKVYIHMIIWIVLKGLRKLHYHHKMHSSTNCLIARTRVQTMRMQLVCGVHFGARQLHDVYLQLDVLLLVDLFEKFRRSCLAFYSLDPLHYYTTPGLAWDAALRMSRVDLELITDENIYNLPCRYLNDISTRYARANNPSFPSTYDDKLPSQDLIYLDANNLYGSAHTWISSHLR